MLNVVFVIHFDVEVKIDVDNLLILYSMSLRLFFALQIIEKWRPVFFLVLW